MTWDIVKIAALVLTLTQVVKNLGPLAKIDARIISVFVTVAVVVGAWLVSGKPFELAQVIQAIVAVIAANGGKKLLESVSEA